VRRHGHIEDKMTNIRAGTCAISCQLVGLGHCANF
jgi:hypothetical protein